MKNAPNKSAEIICVFADFSLSLLIIQ